jgi:hypothetical protein
MLEGALAWSDSVRAVAAREWRHRLAAARARPRHWSCRVNPEQLRAERDKAFRTLVGDDEGAPPDTTAFGLPRRRATFERSFRAIAAAAECRRLAVAIDRAIGLADDTLLIFRIGRVYWLPERMALFGRDGTLLTMFISLD